MASGDTNIQDPDSSSHQQTQIMPETLRQILQEGVNHVFAVTAAIQNANPGHTTTTGRRLPAPKEVIDAMPRILVQEAGNDCAICLNEIGVGCEIKEMPCKHGFHPDCIEQWLGVHGSCPVCRFMIPVEGVVRAGGSGSLFRYLYFGLMD